MENPLKVYTRLGTLPHVTLREYDEVAWYHPQYCPEPVWGRIVPHVDPIYSLALETSTGIEVVFTRSGMFGEPIAMKQIFTAAEMLSMGFEEARTKLTPIDVYRRLLAFCDEYNIDLRAVTYKGDGASYPVMVLTRNDYNHFEFSSIVVNPTTANK
jgi:hypothetical protein